MARRDGPEIMVGMNTPLIATLDGQGRLSKYAAGMAACAAALQALARFVRAIGGTWSVGQRAYPEAVRDVRSCTAQQCPPHADENGQNPPWNITPSEL